MMAAGVLIMVMGAALVIVAAVLEARRPPGGVPDEMFADGLFLLVAGAAIALVGVLFWLVSPGAAHAHDAPSGWTYPLSCCSDYDCREVADAFTPDATVRVLERPDGYVISSTGEVIPMTSRKVRPSPDGVFHWCSTGGRDDGATICLFAPPRGF